MRKTLAIVALATLLLTGCDQTTNGGAHPSVSQSEAARQYVNPANDLAKQAAAVEKSNPAKAFALYSQAADMYHGWSMYKTGMMLASGTGVTKNTSDAYYWLSLAANKNITAAKTALPNVQKMLTASQLAAANAKVAAFKAPAAK